jgi:hypothetical protein
VKKVSSKNLKKFSLIFYKGMLSWLSMEDNLFEDVGEEILFKLQEINRIIKKLMGKQNENERAPALPN